MTYASHRRKNKVAGPGQLSGRVRRAISEALESRRLLAATPTNFEQYMLELINRARANPAAEAARLGIDLNEGLPPATISSSSVQPLAFNPALLASSGDYVTALLGAYNYYGFALNGTTGAGRMAAAGYVFTGAYSSSESLYALSLPPSPGHTPLSVNTANTNTEYNGLFTDSMVSSRGDRLNILNPSFSEIGIGIGGSLTYQGVDTPPSHTNESAVLTDVDFAATDADPSPILTGVVFNDLAHTQFYAPGEGIGNVTITATRTSDNATFNATTWLSGGYSLAVPSGTYDIVASGGSLSAPVTQSNVVVGGQNVEVDFIDAGRKQLTFSQQPASTTNGSTLNSIAVSVNSAIGAVVGGDNSNVSIAIGAGPSGATLGGTTTVAAVNGVATFSDLSLSTPGNYTLTATDESDTAAISTSFAINSTAPAETIGGLDPTFGVGGLASHDVGISSTEGVSLQSNGQSIILGTIGSGSSQSFGVTRYNADGSLDSSFGDNGVASASFGGSDAPLALTLLADGDILVAGTAVSPSGGSQFALAEFTSSGALDTTFGNGTGEVLTSFSASAGTLTNDTANSLVVSPAGGTIYLGGSSDASGKGLDFAIAAYNADGSPNTSFGANGKTLLDFAGGDDVIRSLALQSNGDLVAAGSAATAAGINQVGVARFLPSGALDSHFGSKGKVMTGVNGVDDEATSVVIDSKGHIIVGGFSATGSAADGSLSSNFLLIRYTTTGAVDRSFNGGVVTTSFGQPAAITQLALQSDGSIIASGKTTGSLTNLDPSQLQVAIAQYLSTGRLDTVFDGTGTAVIDLGSGQISPQFAEAPGPSFATESVSVMLAFSPSDSTSALSQAFMQFEQSAQGVVATTQSGELLDVGNSGANTVEAAIITSGINLTAAVIAKLPAMAVEGAKGSLGVKVTDSGGSAASGAVTLQLYASSDGQLDAGLAPFASTPEKLNLRTSQSKTFPLHYTLPNATGAYFILATINPGHVHSLNPNSVPAISSSAVAVAPPFVDLAGANIPSSLAIFAGKPATMSFAVANNGNIEPHSVPVEVLASPDGTAGNGTEIAEPTLLLNLAVGATRTYKLTIVIPTTLAANTYVLVAVLDPADTLNDPNLANHLIVGQTQFTIS